MPGHLSELHPVNEIHTKGQFFRASFGKKPRFQTQLDKRPGRAGAPAGPGAAAGRLGRGERAVPAWTPPGRQEGRAGGEPPLPYPHLARPPPNRQEKGLPASRLKEKPASGGAGRVPPRDPPRSTVNAVEGEWLLWGLL